MHRPGLLEHIDRILLLWQTKDFFSNHAIASKPLSRVKITPIAEIVRNRAHVGELDRLLILLLLSRMIQSLPYSNIQNSRGLRYRYLDVALPRSDLRALAIDRRGQTLCRPPPGPFYTFVSTSSGCGVRLWGAALSSTLIPSCRGLFKRSLASPRYSLQSAALQGGKRAWMGLAVPRIANLAITVGADPSPLLYPTMISSTLLLYIIVMRC